MAGESPHNFGDGPRQHPSQPSWIPPQPSRNRLRPRTWPAVALASFACAMAVAALIVASINGKPTSSVVNSQTSATPSALEAANAHAQLCDSYARAARAVQIESHGGGTALARIATVNGAAMLETAASAPAVKPDERSAALSLARTYRSLTAVGSVVNGSDDPVWRSAIAEVTAADAAMKKVCSGG